MKQTAPNRADLCPKTSDTFSHDFMVKAKNDLKTTRKLLPQLGRAFNIREHKRHVTCGGGLHVKTLALKGFSSYWGKTGIG